MESSEVGNKRKREGLLLCLPLKAVHIFQASVHTYTLEEYLKQAFKKENNNTKKQQHMSLYFLLTLMFQYCGIETTKLIPSN